MPNANLKEKVTERIADTLLNTPWWTVFKEENYRLSLANKLINAYLINKGKNTLTEPELNDLLKRVVSAVTYAAAKPSDLSRGDLAMAQKFTHDAYSAMITALTPVTHIPENIPETMSVQPYAGKNEFDLPLPRIALGKMFRGTVADIFSIQSISKMLDEALGAPDKENRKNFSFTEIEGLLKAYFINGVSEAWRNAVKETYHISAPTIFSMIKIADALDEAGYEQEANEIDSIVRGLLDDQQN